MQGLNTRLTYQVATACLAKVVGSNISVDAWVREQAMCYTANSLIVKTFSQKKIQIYIGLSLRKLYTGPASQTILENFLILVLQIALPSDASNIEKSGEQE